MRIKHQFPLLSIQALCTEKLINLNRLLRHTCLISSCLQMPRADLFKSVASFAKRVVTRTDRQTDIVNQKESLGVSHQAFLKPYKHSDRPSPFLTRLLGTQGVDGDN